MGKQDMWKTKVAKSREASFTDAREGDIIVPVMGPTGAGKSTFINNYLNQQNAARVGHDLQSCTEKLQVFPRPLPADSETRKERRLVLVDTPGFDDTNQSDSEILSRIAAWLASSYGPKKICGGLIYLHDMTDARMRGTTLQNLPVFQKLCGKKNLGSVVFATTKSGKLTPGAFERREKQLSDVYWKDFKKRGAMVFKLLDSHKSADELVSTVLDRVRMEESVLLIQKELVDLAKLLPVTEAGQELKFTLEEIMEHQKKALAGEELTDEQIALHENKIAEVGSQLRESQLKESQFKQWIGKLSQLLKKFFGLA